MSDKLFELTGVEGSLFTDFRVNRWGTLKGGLIKYYGQRDKRKGKCLRVIVQVVGFIDDKVPKRNWGKFSRNIHDKA